MIVYLVFGKCIRGDVVVYITLVFLEASQELSSFAYVHAVAVGDLVCDAWVFFSSGAYTLRLPACLEVLR